MEFSEVVARRRMVRRFDTAPVSPEALERVLRAGLKAPSAGFSQGIDLLVLTQPSERERFWAATTDPDRPADAWLRGVGAAPVLVVCCSDPQAYLDRYAEPDKGWTDRDPARWPIPYWDVDTGMAAMSMLLTAVDEQLGALFFGVPAQRHDAVRAEFGVPSGRRLVGVVALGHPHPQERSSTRKERRPTEDVVHRGEFAVGPPDRPADTR